jgi:Zn-dependent protease with chaperone function
LKPHDLPRTKRGFSAYFTGRIPNTIYSVILLLMLYDWPHQVYRKIGPPMAVSTPRQQFIVGAVTDFASRLKMRIKPTFVMGPAPASAGSFSGAAVVVISPSMLDSTRFTDSDLNFILAHEIGHLARLDAYRFWTRWSDASAEARESDADRIAVSLVGCAAMRATIDHHWGEFLDGFKDPHDHHPHPEARYAAVCSARK